ncbi:MAG: sensor histidine kinase [Terracidiphilus sp.]|nr:sensor histidine kinase [Terracidiphilus sp.]
MQQTGQAVGLSGMQRKRVEAVVETLANLRGNGENLVELAHDARNMVTALGLYCDLLEEPGVLATAYAHYGNELRLVAAASRRLVERLVALDTEKHPEAARLDGPFGDRGRRPVQAESAERSRQARRWDLLPALPIDNLAGELLANRNLLAALAGPSIKLTVDAEGGALAVRLTGEDLTRVLVNLVKNAAEAMPGGGQIKLSLRESAAEGDTPQTLWLTVEDSGPGIPSKALGKIFEAGFSTQAASAAGQGWPVTHRGLGLSISRSIVESVGGRIVAQNRRPAGARFQIELPVRKR